MTNHACGDNSDAAETVHVLARLKPGVVGESRRVIHVVPIPPDLDEMPAVLTAYCGQQFPLGARIAEWLEGPTGMPCEPCFLAAFTPSGNALPTTPREVTTVNNPQDLPKRQPGKNLAKGLARPSGDGQPHNTTMPLHPEVEAWLENWRSLAECTIAAHIEQDGLCPICECGFPCAKVQDAGRNLQLLS